MMGGVQTNRTVSPIIKEKLRIILGGIHMKTRKFFIIWMALVALLLAACSPQAAASEAMTGKDSASDQGMEAETMPKDETGSMEAEMASDAMGHEEDAMMDAGEAMPEDDMMAEADTATHEDEAMMDDEMGEDAMMAETDDTMMEDAMMFPGWLTSELVEARSGESFEIADYQGKVVLVETLAMWCSNCLKQQEQVAALHDLLGQRDDFISLGLDIDPNEDSAALMRYIEERGFGWQYAIAPAEVAREIGQLYGDQFLNPPSTPMLIIDRDGQVHPLPFGIKDAGSLLEALKPYLEAGM
jgi:cytochrome oxidase Cu insertion factor (SCO1/SenC/PrrC family)